MKFHLLPLALAIIAPAVSAQEPTGVKTEVRLLAFSNAIQVKEVFAQDSVAAPETPSVALPIRNYLNHQFTLIELKSRKVIFTTKPDRASLSRPGEIAGEVTIPDSTDSAILMFLPGKPGGNAMYQIMAVPDTKQAFPAGSFNITNLSPLPIRLMLENKNFDFKSGQNILIEKPPARADGQCGMRAFAFKDEKWISVSTGLWTLPGESRGLMILFVDPVSGNVHLQSFDDVPPRGPQKSGG